MSDYTEYYEFYKKAWERSLNERTSKLEAENARYREALEWIAMPNAYHNETNINEPYSAKIAREALKGKK